MAFLCIMQQFRNYNEIKQELEVKKQQLENTKTNFKLKYFWLEGRRVKSFFKGEM